MTRRLPPDHVIQACLLVVLGCALLFALSRDVPPASRDAGQLGALAAWGAMVLLRVGASFARGWV